MTRPNIFIPANQHNQEKSAPKPTPVFVLIIENLLTILAQGLVVASVCLLPLLFVFGTQQTTSFDRVAIASVLAAASLVVAVLLILFKKRISTVFPFALVFLALFVLWGFVSAFAQGDSHDSIWGMEMSQLTVGFSVLILLFTALPLLLQSSTKMLIRALSLIGVVAVIVLLHTIFRYWFGLTWFDFAEFSANNQSLVGGFNDSAIYAGLVVLLGLTTVVMLPLRAYVQAIVTVVMVGALSILLLTNFTLVWVAVLLVSATTTGYVFLRKFLFQSTNISVINIFSKLICAATFVLALLATLYGTSVASYINTVTNTQFVEVRPSFEASLDITREVYQDQMLLGVGPNRFEDAWRNHKNLSINEGVFWNTDFHSGYGYVLTLFTTYGLVGGLLFILFLLSFAFYGVTRLVGGVNDNIFARFVFSLVFIGAAYLWVMTFVYTPSVTLLLLAASLTGLTFANSSVLENAKFISFDVVTNRIRGFISLLIVLLVIVLTYFTINALLDKYLPQTGVDLETVTNNDEIVGQLANQKIRTLNQLIATASPESVSQEDLLLVSKEALETSKRAVELDPTNPKHLQRLASLYGVLGAIGVEGGYKSAKEVLQKAINVDPYNPKHHLARARIQLAENDIESAEASLDKALELKFNYTEAIQLQTELAIAEGDTEDMIEKVKGISQLEPDNAIRWYQLGLLYAASGDTENAIRALLRSLKIDPAYADARYVLALQYAFEDRQQEALSQLRIVETTNPNNSQLLSLIEKIENGEDVTTIAEVPEFIEVQPEFDNESGISVPSTRPSDLIVPVNSSGVTN